MIDAVINIRSKPYQALVAIKSLLKHSGKWINNLYVIFEREYPFSESCEWILEELPKDKIINYTTKHYLMCRVDPNRLDEEDYRLSVMYQYAFENSDSDYLFTFHTDVLFTGDIIGEMAKRIGNKAGVGSIGMCWCCPAKKAGVCDSLKFEHFNPKFEEAVKIVSENKSPRMKVEDIDEDFPMPFTECRLNEFCCLVNLKETRTSVKPAGDGMPFGVTRPGHDTASEWFRDLILRGFKFENWYAGDRCAGYEGFAVHAPITHDPSMGNSVNANAEEYDRVEKLAKKYYESELK